jgi:hypothetical protein
MKKPAPHLLINPKIHWEWLMSLPVMDSYPPLLRLTLRPQTGLLIDPKW